MDLKEVKKAIAQVQGQIFKNSNAQAIGMLKSSFKGAGLQFKEHKVYDHGDDIRFFDWKLSARTNVSYVKTFEEERNVEIDVIIDLNPALLLGHHETNKFHAQLQLSALLYLLSEKTGDRVRPIIWSETERILPFGTGHKGIVQLYSALEKMNILNADGGVRRETILNTRPFNFSEKLKTLKLLVSRRKEVVYLGDLESLALGSSKEKEQFMALTARRNFHVFKIMAPVEGLNRMPFSITANQIRGKKFFMAGSQGQMDQLESKKIHHLRLDERYLEHFIKHLQ